MGSAMDISPSQACTIPAMMIMLKAVIGAVGPLICVAVPPNKAAKKAMKAAP